MLNFEEQKALVDALDKLFKAQGKKIDDETKLLFVGEIKSWPCSIGQITEALKGMYMLDLKVIRLLDIRKAVSEYQAPHHNEPMDISDEERARNLKRIGELKAEHGENWFKFQFAEPKRTEWDAIE